MDTDIGTVASTGDPDKSESVTVAEVIKGASKTIEKDVADTTNKGVKSDNSVAPLKTENVNNIRGRAPKTKTGALDPNRLPDSHDSSSDNATDSTKNIDK